MQTVLTLLKFLPEFLNLAKTILSMLEEGYTDYQVRKSLRGIDKAFKIDNKKDRARALNDIFRK